MYDILIPYDERLKSIASAWNKRILAKSWIKNNPNYAGQTLEDRYYVGSLGELHVLKYLKTTGKWFHYAPKADGSPDDQDFVIQTDYRQYTVDVKTSNYQKSDRMLFNKLRFDKSQQDIYIACHQAETGIVIKGYCFRSDIHEFKWHDQVDNKYVGVYYKELSDFADLVSQMVVGQYSSTV